MKQLLIFLLIYFCCSGQAQDIQVSLLIKADYSQPKYELENEVSLIDRSAKTRFGYTVSLEAEQNFNAHFSWYGGVGYQYKKFYPRGGMTWHFPYYTPAIHGILEFASFNLNPIKHEFHLLSIPLGIKWELGQNNKVSPFFGLGIESAFRFSEKETYIYYSNPAWINRVTDPKNSYSYVYQIRGNNYREDSFEYFGTALTCVWGLTVKMNPKNAILFQSRVNVVEYRNRNDARITNDYTLWKNSLLMFGQISMGLGWQRAF